MAPKLVSQKIIYSKLGTQPPIYLAGSFSEPEWQPKEMQYTTDPNNEHEFYHEVKVEEGKEYQYKFRIGKGEWWMLDENAPTVTDAIGNQNNLLAVPVTEEHTNSIESRPAASTPHQEETQAPTGLPEMDHSYDHAEESIGTRETSDVLFSDEIVKDEEPQADSMPLTPQPEPLKPHPTSATGLGSKTGQLTRKQNGLNIADPTKFTESISTPPITLSGEKIRSSAPVVEVQEPQIEHIEEKDSKENNGLTDTPIVIVEKVNTEPSYGDDFGHDATIAQKDAHNLRSQDAEPDYTVIQQHTRTPELANVAAEVADSAAKLDEDVPTPPVSDEEAGRTGYRRISNTPIPEVAATAAEVAEVAATIDKPSLGDLFETRSYFEIINDESLEFPETPPEMKAPYFPHEIGGSSPIAPRRQSSITSEPRRSSKSQEPIDLNDPSIEMFPTDREGIMEHLRKMQMRIPEDQADCVGGPDSLIIEEIHHSPLLNVATAKSPAMMAQERSPSLDSIAEEYDSRLVQLPSAAKNGAGDLPTLSEAEDEKEEAADAKPVINGVHSKEPQQSSADSSKKEVDEKTDQAEDSVPASKQTDEHSKPEAVVHVADHDESASLSKDLGEVAVAEIPSVTVLEVEAVHQDPLTQHEVDRSLDGADSPGTKTPLPIASSVPTTPFVVGDRQLGHEEGVVQHLTTNGPDIFVEPATPMDAPIKSDPFDKPLNAENTTAFESNNGSADVEPRKRQPSPGPDRLLTPSSLLSTGKHSESQNFLKAFCRVVFSWIGGTIMRLSGGRDRRRT